MSRTLVATRVLLGLTLAAGVAVAVGANATPSPSYSVKGIDISKYQHPGGAGINWSQVKASGVKFVIVGATQGTSSTPANPYFQADYKAVKDNGLIRGAYHFATPSTAGGEATTEAKVFLAAIGGTKTHEAGDLAPVLDLETRNGLSDSQLVTWTQQFASEVFAETGRQPILYTSSCFFATGCSGPPSSLRYLPLWVAAYTSAPNPNPTGWSMWQWSSSSSVPGISGAVDTNVFNASQSALVNTFGDGRNPAIQALWNIAGGANGSLGTTSGDETQIANGVWDQEYTKGATAVWSAATGAMPLYDAFRSYWKSKGTETGLPTGYGYGAPGGSVQAFQNEDLMQNGTGQVLTISGDIRSTWRGAQNHQQGLGVALTPMSTTAGLGVQEFTNGRILVTPAGTTVLWNNDPTGLLPALGTSDTTGTGRAVSPHTAADAATGALTGRAR